MPRVTFVIGVTTGAAYMKYADDFWTGWIILFVGILLVNFSMWLDDRYLSKGE